MRKEIFRIIDIGCQVSMLSTRLNLPMFIVNYQYYVMAICIAVILVVTSINTFSQEMCRRHIKLPFSRIQIQSSTENHGDAVKNGIVWRNKKIIRTWAVCHAVGLQSHAPLNYSLLFYETKKCHKITINSLPPLFSFSSLLSHRIILYNFAVNWDMTATKKKKVSFYGSIDP